MSWPYKVDGDWRGGALDSKVKSRSLTPVRDSFLSPAYRGRRDRVPFGALRASGMTIGVEGATVLRPYKGRYRVRNKAGRRGKLAATQKERAGGTGGASPAPTGAHDEKAKRDFSLRSK